MRTTPMVVKVAAALSVGAMVVMSACSGDSDGAAGGGARDGQSDTTTTTVEVFSSELDPVTSSTPEKVELADGSTAWVVDTGPEDGTPVLFVGGSATSATAVDLVSFLGSAREDLGIRLISVERNGFGDTPLDPDAGYDEFATTAVGVLDAKGIDDFSIVAISGGGPYAQHVAAAVPDRVRSVHFAAAYSGTPDAGSLKALCGLDPAARASLAQSYSADPASWWAFPDDAVAHRIPGFVDAAVADGRRALQNPAAMTHEFDLFCRPTEVDLSAVGAPAFLYYSPDDTTTPPSFADWYAARLPNVVADRRDLSGNHDEQYRHWDQILADLAWPEEPRTVVCGDGEPPAAGSIPGACLG